MGPKERKGLERRSLDEFATRSTWGKLDARAKLIGVIVFVVATALLTDQRLVFISLTASIVMVASSNLPIRHVTVLFLGTLPFILIASLSFFLFTGISNGFTMFARASACVVALIVLTSTTQTFDLFSGLRRLRVPATITTLLMLTHKFIALLSAELDRMMVARRARGFSGGRHLLDKYALKVISFTAGMVLVKSSARADRVYEGLKSRGFEKDLVGWRTGALRTYDVAFIILLSVVSVALLAAQRGVVF